MFQHPIADAVGYRGVSDTSQWVGLDGRDGPLRYTGVVMRSKRRTDGAKGDRRQRKLGNYQYAMQRALQHRKAKEKELRHGRW